jgi:hypothetical protein
MSRMSSFPIPTAACSFLSPYWLVECCQNLEVKKKGELVVLSEPICGRLGVSTLCDKNNQRCFASMQSWQF